MEQRPPEFGRFAEPSLLILSSLSDGPKHGYAIMQDVEKARVVRWAPARCTRRLLASRSRASSNR